MATPIDRARLTYELDRRGLTFADLAREIDCPPSTLSEVRRGRPVRRPLLLRIVAALGRIPVLEGADELLAVPGGRSDTKTPAASTQRASTDNTEQEAGDAAHTAHR